MESDTAENNELKHINNISNTDNHNESVGYYDAEKCRAHLANQIRVSKIDRFSSQISKALEIEVALHSRLCKVLDLFMKRSADVAYEFTLRCKIGFERHHQDRILNHSKAKRRKTVNSTPNKQQSTEDLDQFSLGNDLLYGEGAQLLRLLLNNQQPSAIDNSIQISEQQDLNSIQPDLFEPSYFVKTLEHGIRNNMQLSRKITAKLETLRQSFERLASEHRDQVDLVYAAEEERQATTVVRRSAYNLAVVANKATSTPVHVTT